MVTFSEIFDFQNKSSIKAGDGLSSGTFPLFTSSPVQSKYYPSSQFDVPSLIFGTGGGASIHSCDMPFSVSTDCLVAQLKPSAVNNFDIRFIYYYLFGNMRILEKGFKGAGLKHTSKAYINSIKIPERSFAEQKQIVNMLELANSMRNKRKKTLTLIDRYLKNSFDDLFGDSISNPHGWKEVTLEELCSKVIDCPHSTPKYTDGQTEFPCIRSSDLQGGFLDFSSTKYIDEAQHVERTRRSVPIAGDIIYCREGARFGQAGYLPKGIKASLGQRTMLLRSNPDYSTSEFLWGLMLSRSVIYQASKYVSGAAAPHINVKDIKNFNVFRPPLELQSQYSEIFRKTMKTKLQMQTQQQEFDNQFQSLLQNIFN